VRGIQIRLPSEFAVLEPLQIFIEGIGAATGVEEDELSSLSISVIELVKNGMEHGNGSDPQKMVTISVDSFDSRIRFFIDDEGTWAPENAPGFKPGGRRGAALNQGQRSAHCQEPGSLGRVWSHSRRKDQGHPNLAPELRPVHLM